MPSIIVTDGISVRLAVLGLLLVLPGATATADNARLLTAVAALAPADLPSLDRIEEQCGRHDTLCAAHLLVEALGPRARLEGVRHPDTDSIRWARSLPSVAAHHVGEDGVLTIDLTRFGRTAPAEMLTALQSAPVRAITLDLRNNGGGDFDRMLRVAALFTGPVPDALTLSGKKGVTRVAIPSPLYRVPDLPLRVLIGPDTTSSGEMLAGLLKVYADAHLVGDTTNGKDWLSRVIPVSHDVRLLVPAERVTIPGLSLVGGVRPDDASPR